jgi:DNA-binding transcriptional regulator GbsR (MarR family)
LTDKENFLNLLAQMLEQDHQLSPLGAKIYALLIIADQKFYTFNEIVALTNASKSFVSTQLKELLDRNKIVFENKDDSRKRFFKTNQHYVNDMLQAEYLDASNHADILKQLTYYKKDNQMAKILLEYYQHSQCNIEATLKKINQIQKQKNDE